MLAVDDVDRVAEVLQKGSNRIGGSVVVVGVDPSDDLAARAVGEDLSLPDLSPSSASISSAPTQEADGLEIPLRLSVLWQQVSAHHSEHRFPWDCY